MSDDLDFLVFTAALEAHIKVLKSKEDGLMLFGPHSINRSVYIAGLESLLESAKQDATGEFFRKHLRERFDAYEVYGQDEWGQVYITSYFAPVMDGSLTPDPKFTQPLYSVPKDMVSLNLKDFSSARSDLPSGVLRGRVTADNQFMPYADRAQIDQGVVKKQSKVLAWVDPIDAFFLEIQGSGTVRLKNGKEMNVGYASQNGHPYTAIGKHLFDIIPQDKMSMQAIESHLRSLPPGEARKLMQNNPSYVFFRQLERAPMTAIGAEVTSGRTIATDGSYFPKGALAYLEFEKPVFNSPTDAEPVAWQPTARFVLDQDTGGAIKGPHRVDLFWGQGPLAKQSAGVMKNKGRLVYFVPKQEINKLN